MGTLWDTMSSVPDWPEVAGLSVRDWGVPSLYIHGGQHAPDVTFARFDFAYDEAQVFYGNLVGVAADDLVTLMDHIEAEVETQGVPLASYTAPEERVLGPWRDLVYELEVEDVRLIDWIGQLVEGEVPPDVHCVDCR